MRGGCGTVRFKRLTLHVSRGSMGHTSRLMHPFVASEPILQFRAHAIFGFPPKHDITPGFVEASGSRQQQTSGVCQEADTRLRVQLGLKFSE